MRFLSAKLVTVNTVVMKDVSLSIFCLLACSCYGINNKQAESEHFLVIL